MICIVLPARLLTMNMSIPIYVIMLFSFPDQGQRQSSVDIPAIFAGGAVVDGGHWDPFRPLVYGTCAVA